MEKGDADRQAWMVTTFQKGKAAYEEGNFESAIEAWDKLSPYLDENSEEKELIQKLKKSYAEAEQAQKETREAIARQSIKLQAPPEFKGSLLEAEQKLNSQISEAKTGQEAAEKNLADKQAWIASTFQKGRAFYEGGKLEEALQEWEKLSAYLDDQPEIRSEIERLRQIQHQLEDAKSTTAEFASNEYKALKAPYTGEIERLLSQVNDDLKSKAAKALDQKSEMQKTLTERQDWIASTFQKGKNLYGDGKYKEAMDIWETITPYLENEVEVKSYILTARQNLDAFDLAQKSLADVSSGSEQKFKAPEELSKLLNDSISQMDSQLRQAQAQKTKAEQTLEEREKNMNAAFEKGKAFYVQGMYAEAMDAWKEMIPFLENKAPVEALLQKLAETNVRWIETQKAVEDAKNRNSGQFAPPADLAQLLEKANKDLQSQIEAATSERGAMEKSLAEREAWMASTMQKGKTAYEAGQLDQAITEWEKIAAYLDPAAEEKNWVMNLKKKYADALEAKRKNQEAIAQKGIKLEAPETFKQFLLDANDKLTSQMNEAKIEHEAMEKSAADRQAWISSTFQRGRVSSSDGKWTRP